ncbi:MAG: SUMF1/EgtB/PvdO family nonheme iron enzyme [Gammaproteobacteria bacterium]|nr:SUMF1/EgtB/PvdO family nonheme iron enzyme [Gammaproteobacteria bacterium]
MQREQHLEQLGLASNANNADIEAAIAQKREQLQQRLATAPTEALQAKYQAALTSLAASEAALLTPTHRDISASLFDDMPQTASQFDDAALSTVRLQPGTLLASRYEIKGQIGQGGMGAVYQAFDKNTNEDIAVKVMQPSLLNNERARERFLNEARISQKLSHPNIVNVFDVQQDGELFFLTMELLEGQDLRQAMQQRKLARQLFSIEEALDIAKAVGAALTYAHKFTIHRDIKPENIWVSADGDIKIMDFGIAQVQSTSQRTKTGAAMGTAYYMAPEQLKGSKDIDGRADQYALAVMLYELLSGEVPAGMIEPLPQHRKDVSKSFAAAVHKALATKAENRFATLDEFITALSANSSVLPTLPSISPKTLGLAAGIIAVIATGVWVSQGNWSSEGLKQLLPQSQAELSQQKAQLAKLVGQINVTKKRLEESRSKLAQDLRDAEREQGNSKALKSWQALTEQHLFNGNQISELEGELAMAETFNRDGEFNQANQSYQKVLKGYNQQLTEFNAAGQLYGASQQTANAKNQWFEVKSEYSLTDPAAVQQALKQEQQAEDATNKGVFTEALNAWQQAQNSWQQAPNERGEDIAAVKAQWRQNELDAQTRAKAEAQERSRLAALAKAKAKAEAEAKEQAQVKVREAEIREAALVEEYVGQLVIIPAGSFMMGCSEGDSECFDDEKPQHSVHIQSFKLMSIEVTFAMWDACVAAGGCSYQPEDKGWGRSNRPVIYVSYEDITQQFIPWLNQASGQRFRLPTEAEWEYAARAGSSTKYSWGNSISCSQARYGQSDGDCGNARSTLPVKSFSANAFGLYDMHGNVWEWAADCWNDNYQGAPSNGSAWQSGDCERLVLRGGSWLNGPRLVRVSDRNGYSASDRNFNYGFRLAQDL